MINFNEKIAICYTPCGPTYRKTALDKLTNYYPDHPNLYYCILTDDKSYFKDLKKPNLIVNELKDFYPDFPCLEKNEAFLESTSPEDYGEKCLRQNYKFSFSSMRFHLLQAKNFGVSNIALLCTDTVLKLDYLTDEILQKKNMLYNGVSIWPIESNDSRARSVMEILKGKYNLTTDEKFMVFDAATRFFVLQDQNFLETFFYIWNDIITTLYQTNQMSQYTGWVMMNDEYILAPLYNALKLYGPEDFTICNKMFEVHHNQKEERFWAC